MNREKSIYLIFTIFVMLSISIAPIMGQSIADEKVYESKKVTNNDDLVVAKAATSSKNSTSATSTTTTTTSTKNTTQTSSKTTTSTANKTTVSTQPTSNSSKTTTKVSKPTKVSQSQILKTSVTVNKFVTKYNKLPNYVTINNYKFSMPEYMYLLSKTITLKYNKKTSNIVVKYGLKNPRYPSGNNIKGTLTKKQYYTYAKNVVNYLTKYKTAPNYVNTKLGKMQYQTAIFALNKVVYWMKTHKNKVPSTITLNVAKTKKINKITPTYNGNLDESTSSCGNNTNNANTTILPDSDEELIVIVSKNFRNVGPTLIKYNSQYLISTAKCSCGCAGDYCYHTATFINYCPFCKKSGCMVYEEAYDWPEGIWVCSSCDADFCLVTGKEHIIGTNKYLTKA